MDRQPHVDGHRSQGGPNPRVVVVLVPAVEGGLTVAYETADGTQTRAARLLGLNRDTFRYRATRYGVKEQR